MYADKKNLKREIETEFAKMLRFTADPRYANPVLDKYDPTMYKPCVYMQEEPDGIFWVGNGFCVDGMKPGEKYNPQAMKAGGSAILIHVYRAPDPEAEVMTAIIMGFRSVELMKEHSRWLDRQAAAETYMKLKLANRPSVIVLNEVCLDI